MTNPDSQKKKSTDINWAPTVCWVGPSDTVVNQTEYSCPHGIYVPVEKARNRTKYIICQELLSDKKNKAREKERVCSAMHMDEYVSVFYINLSR